MRVWREKNTDDSIDTSHHAGANEYTVPGSVEPYRKAGAPMGPYHELRFTDLAPGPRVLLVYALDGGTAMKRIEPLTVLVRPGSSVLTVILQDD